MIFNVVSRHPSVPNTSSNDAFDTNLGVKPSGSSGNPPHTPGRQMQISEAFEAYSGVKQSGSSDNPPCTPEKTMQVQEGMQGMRGNESYITLSDASPTRLHRKQSTPNATVSCVDRIKQIAFAVLMVIATAFWFYKYPQQYIVGFLCGCLCDKKIEQLDAKLQIMFIKPFSTWYLRGPWIVVALVVVNTVAFPHFMFAFSLYVPAQIGARIFRFFEACSCATTEPMDPNKSQADLEVPKRMNVTSPIKV